MELAFYANPHFPSTMISVFKQMLQDLGAVAAFFEGDWIQLPWNNSWIPVGIMAKELAPILLSIAVWGTRLAKKQVLIQCDNMSVVQALSKRSDCNAFIM